MFSKSTIIRDSIVSVVGTLFTAWIIWVSYTLVETQRTTDLIEFKIDSISPVLQGLSEGS